MTTPMVWAPKMLPHNTSEATNCQQRYVKILELHSKDASLSIEAHDIDNYELKVVDVSGMWKLKLWQ